MSERTNERTNKRRSSLRSGGFGRGFVGKRGGREGMRREKETASFPFLSRPNPSQTAATQVKEGVKEIMDERTRTGRGREGRKETRKEERKEGRKERTKEGRKEHTGLLLFFKCSITKHSVAIISFSSAPHFLGNLSCFIALHR